MPRLLPGRPLTCEEKPAALADGELEFGTDVALVHIAASERKFGTRSDNMYVFCCDRGGLAVHS